MKLTILLLALSLPLLVIAPLSAGAQTVAPTESAAPATSPAATTSPVERVITVKVILEGAAEYEQRRVPPNEALASLVAPVATPEADIS
jgi:Na+-transporting methylmalonyl-CoA/oxaloacetate decarboxylase gamma subunit